MTSATSVLLSSWRKLILAFSAPFATLALILVLVLPSGLKGPLSFDGLPWSNPIETIAVVVLLPFLLATNHRFLTGNRKTLGFLGLILLLKAVAVFSPENGLNCRVYRTPQLFEQGRFEPTYQSTWNASISANLHHALASFYEYPLEWINEIEDERFRAHPQAIVELEGSILTGGLTHVMVVAGTSIQPGSHVTLTDGHGARVAAPLLPSSVDLQATPGAAISAPSSVLAVRATLVYRGSDWRLGFYGRDASHAIVPLDMGRVFFTDEGNATSYRRFGRFFETVNATIVLLMVLMGVAWTVSAVSTLVGSFASRRSPRILFLVAPGISVALAFGLHTYMSELVRVKVDLLLLSGYLILVSSIGVLVFVTQRERVFLGAQAQIGRILLFTIGPSLLAYFTCKWFSDVGVFSMYSIGDDWLTYQNFARRIALGGEWLTGGEDAAFFAQPLYRYFVAILHILFGQSSFAQNMLDVWSILGGGILASSIVRLYAGEGSSHTDAPDETVMLPVAVFGTAVGTTVLFLSSNLRYHIGRGLQEPAAMLVQMCALFYLARTVSTRDHNAANLATAILCAVVAFWLRTDHFVLLLFAGVIFLSGRKAGERDLRGFLVFEGSMLLSLFLLMLRNHLVGGQFAVNPQYFARLSQHSVADGLATVKTLLLAVPEGTNVISSPFVLVGLSVAVFAIVLRRVFAEHPLFLGWAVLGGLLPYVFVQPRGYVPRFVIHLLPLATMSICFLVFTLAKSRWGRRLRSFSPGVAG